MSVLALILAGGPGPNLSVLTKQRSEASVPFGGKYRVIDFPLSNCVNSGIYNVAVLTQYMPRSLNEHIRTGKPWDLDRANGGVRLLQPYQNFAGEQGAWQEGSADAVRFNLDVLRESGAEQILVLSGNHIYKMNYRFMLESHRQRKADVTVAVRAVNPHQSNRYGMVSAGANGRIARYEEKPRRTRLSLASMGIYIFNRQVLEDWLTGTGKQAKNLGADVLPTIVKRKRVFTYEFEGYWANIGTIPAYYEANMSLLADTPALDLSDERWVVHTRSQQYPPVWLGPDAEVRGNLLSDGARIEGKVRRSIIGPGVVVAPGAVVRDSIILNDTVIGAGAVVERAIIDKRVVVDAGALVGGAIREGGSAHAHAGITLVEAGARVGAG